MNAPTLKICGNPVAAAGYNDLYTVNNGCGNIFIPNMGKTGMSTVPYYFVVRITANCVQYILAQDSGIQSFGSSRDGCLKIGIAIPKHQRLKNGRSPYDVLMDVYSTMKERNTSSMPGTTILQYQERMCDESIFEELLQRYPLEEYISAYRPMTGQSDALLVVPDLDKIKEFMKDPHYRELQTYSEIIVAHAGDHSPRITVPSIPRNPQYQLRVDNRSSGDFTYDSRIDISYPSNIDRRCYKVPSPFTISIADIIEYRPLPNGVKATVDKEREVISCTLPPLEPREEEWSVDIRGDGYAQKMYHGIKIRLSNNQIINVDDRYTFKLKGEDIIAAKTIQYSGDDYNITSQQENQNARTIQIVAKKRQPITSQSPIGSTRYQKIEITVPVKAFSELKKGNPEGIVKVYSGGDRKISYRDRVAFTPKNKGKYEIIGWSGNINIPSSFMPKDNMPLQISIETKKAKYYGIVRWNADRRIVLKDEGWKSIPFHKRHNSLIIMLGLLLVFIAGLILGYYARPYDEQKDNSIEGPGSPVGASSGSEEEGVNDFDERCNSILAQDTVTFAQIDALYKEMTDANGIPDSTKQLIEAYHKVVETLKNPTNFDKKGKNEKTYKDNLFDVFNELGSCNGGELPQNVVCCRILYKKRLESDSGWNLNMMKNAQQLFLKSMKADQIKSFKDIEKIKEDVEKIQQQKTSPADQPSTGKSSSGKSSQANHSESGSGSESSIDLETER